jgi:hypothetical protein
MMIYHGKVGWVKMTQTIYFMYKSAYQEIK